MIPPLAGELVSPLARCPACIQIVCLVNWISVSKYFGLHFLSFLSIINASCLVSNFSKKTSIHGPRELEYLVNPLLCSKSRRSMQVVKPL
jgi:hypothetical protein